MKRNDKMQPVYNSVVKEIQGNGAVQTVVLEDVRTGKHTQESVSGVFVYIGHEPNSALFQGQLEMDHEGYVIVDSRLHTSVPGVFAAGEIHDKVFRQAIASAGFGCMASMEAEKFIAELPH